MEDVYGVTQVLEEGRRSVLTVSVEKAFTALPENLVYNCEKASFQDMGCDGGSGGNGGGSTKTTHICASCEKRFASAWALSRHHTRFPLCKKWMELSPNEVAVVPKDAHTDDFFAWINNLVRESTEETSGENTCKHCKETYSNNSNFRKHYSGGMCSKWAQRDIIHRMVSLRKI